MRTFSSACSRLQYVLCPISGWKCAKCEMRENLWLNLTDGSVLCGKWFFDGSGGNGHALDHYKESNFPLAVKLDTITPDGTGTWRHIFASSTMFEQTFNGCFVCVDVYSFDEEEAVLDPQISEHLLHFGIDMLQMQRVCFLFLIIYWFALFVQFITSMWPYLFLS